MIACTRGDIVLVRFQYTDESGWKNRPVLILYSLEYQRRRQELIVAAITSNVSRTLYGDYAMTAWNEAGLLFPSMVTGILRTIKRDMVHRRLGTVPDSEMRAVEATLSKSLALQKNG